VQCALRLFIDYLLLHFMRLLAKWIIIALLFLALPEIISGITITASFGTALLVAFFWGVAQSLIRPIILLVLLPINLLTLGLFTFVVNALLLWGIGNIIQGFSVEGFVPAFLGALILAVAGMLINAILKEREE
jgi:putative membrane protein